MARWLVHRFETQLAVNGMSELRDMARTGRLGPGDLVQAPGQSGWVYAVEIPELKDHLPMEEEVESSSRGKGLRWAVALVLLGVAGAAGFGAWDFASRVPEERRSILDRITFSEMVVTGKAAQLVQEPEASSKVVAPATKDGIYELLAKRGGFYKARDKVSGTEGWISIDQVMPMYQFGGGKVVAKYDPLYNPDRYLTVENASWQELPDPRKKNVTVFQFMLQNASDYDMTDLVMVARIKDAKGHDLEQVEFPVTGIVPAASSTMVGTITANKEGGERRLVTQASFEEMASADPDLRLEYSDGVEVGMSTPEFTEATIEIVELRAIPKADEGS